MMMEKHVMRLMSVLWEQTHVKVVAKTQMVDISVLVTQDMSYLLMAAAAKVSSR